MKTILVDAIGVFVNEDASIFDEMRKMLEEFPNRKIILTSASDEQMKRFGLDDMSYEVFTLKHNPEKTNQKYYRMMLEHFSLSAEDVVYFEHNKDAAKSASSVGILTHYYDSDKRDLDSLKKFLADNL